MVADVENPVSDVSLDIESLEKELNNSDWSRGWEQGRIDMMKQMKENFLPRNDQVLRSAEIVVNIMKKKFGDVFGRIFAGFNGHFDEPAVLLCLKEGADCKRIDVVSFGVDGPELFAFTTKANAVDVGYLGCYSTTQGKFGESFGEVLGESIFYNRVLADAERQKIMDTYRSRIGTMVSGEVIRLEQSNIIVRLGKQTEAMIPYREQIKRERWAQGNSTKAVIARVE